MSDVCYYDLMLYRCTAIVCFFFKQKTAYEMRISDWSSDVCSSDLIILIGIGNIEPDFRLLLVRRCFLLLLLFGLVHCFPFPLGLHFQQIGRASCRERVCQYVSISVFAVSLKQKPICTRCISSSYQAKYTNIHCYALQVNRNL